MFDELTYIGVLKTKASLFTSLRALYYQLDSSIVL